jgi:hypothetical protein
MVPEPLRGLIDRAFSSRDSQSEDVQSKEKYLQRYIQDGGRDGTLKADRLLALRSSKKPADKTVRDLDIHREDIVKAIVKYATDVLNDMVRRDGCLEETRDLDLDYLERLRQKVLTGGSSSGDTRQRDFHMRFLVDYVKSLHSQASRVERETDIIPPQYSAGDGPSPQNPQNETENAP